MIPNLVLKFPRKWPKSMWKSYGKRRAKAERGPGWRGREPKGLAGPLPPAEGRKAEPADRRGLPAPHAAPAPPHLPVLADHDVVAVPVSDAQHIGGHTVASAGEGELLDGAIQGLPGGET